MGLRVVGFKEQKFRPIGWGLREPSWIGPWADHLDLQALGFRVVIGYSLKIIQEIKGFIL